MNSQPDLSPLDSIIPPAAGWVVLIMVLAAECFVVPHDEHFAPELGPSGAFLVFSAALTAIHLLNFSIISVFRRFGVVVACKKPLLSALRGAIAFAVLTSICLALFGTRKLHDLLLCSAYLAVSGAVSFYTLSRLRRAKEDDLSRE